ncbi:hypothetical protein QQF64_011582 [Cirrhinus molitorella]|uniref:Secreted protein n=1 Tax=Cirrhinus molitorella TaxID=172907 RepID=A0ABR3LZN8_9TELE
MHSRSSGSLLLLSICLPVGPSSLVRSKVQGPRKQGLDQVVVRGFVDNNASGETAWLAAQFPSHTSCVTSLYSPEVDRELV